ncbi:1,4-dihydroxy-6-naphthoate synthase, partial [Mannheimia sp. HC-2023]
RIKHKSVAGTGLKIIVKTLTKSTKNIFYKALRLLYLKHQDFLNERSEYPNEKGYTIINIEK